MLKNFDRNQSKKMTDYSISPGLQRYEVASYNCLEAKQANLSCPSLLLARQLKAKQAFFLGPASLLYSIFVRAVIWNNKAIIVDTMANNVEFTMTLMRSPVEYNDRLFVSSYGIFEVFHR